MRNNVQRPHGRYEALGQAAQGGRTQLFAHRASPRSDDIEARAISEGWDKACTELEVLRAKRPGGTGDSCPRILFNDPDADSEQILYRPGHEPRSSQARGRCQALEVVMQCWHQFTKDGAPASLVRERVFVPWLAKVEKWAAEPVTDHLVMPPMPEECLDVDAAMQAGRLWHGGHPILAWMAGHCAVRRDDNDNIMPSKGHSTARIDGIVATIIGLSRAMFQEPVRRSVYETRGVIEVEW